MASPAHFNDSSLRAEEVDPVLHSLADPSIALRHNDVPIPPVPSSPAAPASAASRRIPPVPKFLAENSPTRPSLASSPKKSDGLEGALPSASSSVAPVRKLPPVPKFVANDSSMRPPSSKLSTGSRGHMGPPPVPKFQQSSSEEKKSMGPPMVSPAPSSDEPSHGLERPPSEEVKAEIVVVGNGEDAATTGQGNGVSALEGSSKLPLAEKENKREHRSAGSSSGQPPYFKPSWSAAPGQPYTLEIIKEGNILGMEDVSKKGAYMFGRSDRCDFVMEHPTVSRYHAVLQYNSKGESFLYDLGSTHGSFINKVQVKGRAYVPLHVGDIVRFGFSSCLHVFQGPLDLMPKEGLSKKERQAQRLIESADDRAVREASINRARKDAIAADGISWGMQEDAEEEAEENVEEVTWQTFKGELTEKQQKTLGKLHKYNDKLSNLRKENDAIQAKEISQGGLTQGQQTQVARNEQRMEQLVEEVENLEETLNDSIQESISGRTGVKRRGKNDPFDEEEEEDLSDDEFYDRASKGQPRKKKEVVQKVETADSLLDQKAALTTEIEDLREAIKAEEKTSSSSQAGEGVAMEIETVDPLDQFMTHLSSTILKDKASQLQKELGTLSKELERVERLLKLADPTGEGLKKWELKKSAQDNQEAESLTKETNRISSRKGDAQEFAIPSADVNESASLVGPVSAGVVKADDDEDKSALPDQDTAVLPGLEPPLRLGAPMPETVEEVKPEISAKVHEEAVSFIAYKERKKVIGSMPQVPVAVRDEEQKVTEKKEDVSVVDLHVADSVALLLRQKRGLAAEDSDPLPVVIVEQKPHSKQSSKKRKKQVLAEESHSIDIEPSEDWVPPAGQTGDGRTALNDKYGY